MNIFCVSDSGYVEHLATMLLSLVENNAQHDIRIFVGSVGNSEIVEPVRAMLAGRAMVSVISIGADQLPEVTSEHQRYVSGAAYARLMMADLLPVALDRVLYLDCDLVVRGDLEELWRTDLFGKAIGAVSDAIPSGAREFAHIRQLRLGLLPEAPHFNSGVMLVALRRWRELGIGQRALDFVRRYPERCIYGRDQGPLNVVAQKEWLPLDPKWNFQTGHICDSYDDVIRFKRIPRRTRDSIKIVHFSSESKPWHYLNYHPMKREYLTYRKRTPWPLKRFGDRIPHNVIYRLLHRRFPPLLSIYLAARRIV